MTLFQITGFLLAVSSLIMLGYVSFTNNQAIKKIGQSTGDDMEEYANES